ncbi:MAG: hypothetical protein M1825_004526 [Sarcosagium campestre]|nr:MAG: hypothetical protein M1825_004526 [Sarcosagium campestre]
MGTRGYKVFRFRGRYYAFYNHFDSYPDGLGAAIVREIPSNPDAYQEWLAERRAEAQEWHDALERYLCHDDDYTLVTLGRAMGFGKPGRGNVWDVETDRLPDYTPATHDVWIEWVYTIDLDNEIFSIDNGAHLRLDRIPRSSWIDAIDFGYHGDRILLPGSGVPDDALGSLVPPVPQQSHRMLDAYKRLDVEVVRVRGKAAYPATRQLGTQLRSLIFRSFRNAHRDVLSAILFGLKPDDFYFRELAYAVLCLASADLSLSLVRHTEIEEEDHMDFARIACSPDAARTKSAEFLSRLGVGSHLKHLAQGTAPEETTYWFDGTLVHLSTFFFYDDNGDALHADIALVVERCRSERRHGAVDAILLSIEHVVLMTVWPQLGRVERSEPLDLFRISLHLSTSAYERYNDEELDILIKWRQGELQRHEEQTEEDEDENDDEEDDGEDEGEDKDEEQPQEKEKQQRHKDDDANLKDDGKLKDDKGSKDDKPAGDEKGGKIENGKEEGKGKGETKPETTKERRERHAKESEKNFLALTMLLEGASRRRLAPYRRANEGVFPTEIYRQILESVGDRQTHHACAQVSRTFRDLCQERVMLMDDIVFHPRVVSPPTAVAEAENDGHGDSDDDQFPLKMRMTKISTGQTRDVKCESNSGDSYYTNTWRIIVGSERDRRSLLPNVIQII